MNISQFFRDWRVLLYIIILFSSIAYLIYAILYHQVIVENSIIIPNGSVIYSINNCKVSELSQLYSCFNTISNQNYIQTSNGLYILNYTQFLQFENSTFLQESIINYGVDIGGGYTIILNSTQNLSQSEIQLATEVLENRMNAYGIKSINIYYTPEGYIIIQLPYSEGYLINYLTEQGVFYAKIGNITVFNGTDILSILNNPQNSGIIGCNRFSNGWVCEYEFGLVISQQAAENFAKATQNLSVVFEGGQAFLSEPIVFYLDNQNVSTLNIAANLKGQPATQVSIQVSGIGPTEAAAVQNAIQNAKNIEIILANGQLPAKFNIVEIIKIPPEVGYYVLKYIIEASIITIFISFIILFISYRKLKIAFLLLLTMLSELIISLAISIAIGVVMDIPAILGILLGMSTGIDDQLVSAEEILRGKQEMKIKERIGKAMFIIMVAILLEFISVFPIFIGGLGLFKGFATTMIITILIGYFITRPSFIRIAEKLL